MFKQPASTKTNFVISVLFYSIMLNSYTDNGEFHRVFMYMSTTFFRLLCYSVHLFRNQSQVLYLIIWYAYNE